MGKCEGEVCGHPDMLYEWEVYTVKDITAEGKIIWELDTKVMEAVDQYRREVVFVVKKFTLTPGKLYRFSFIIELFSKRISFIRSAKVSFTNIMA